MACSRALAPTRASSQYPASIRPFMLATTISRARSYHSYEQTTPPPYPEAETAILSSALSHVPTLGFTVDASRAGARDAGFRDASSNSFPRAEFELVLFHSQTQRLGLGHRVQFPTPGEGKKGMGVGAKVRALVLERLRGNVEAGVVGRWQEALALMSSAGNIPPSMKESGLLSDEIWFSAGDMSVDSSWYTRRASSASVYAATEVFQTTDQSSDMKDTAQFSDRRLEEVRVLGGAFRNVREWAGFQAMAGVNSARSLGARI